MNIAVSYHRSSELIERSVWNTLASHQKLHQLVHEHTEELRRKTVTNLFERRKKLRKILCKKYLKRKILAEKILPEAMKSAVIKTKLQLHEQLNAMITEILHTVLQEGFSTDSPLSKRAFSLLKKSLRASPTRIMVGKGVRERLIAATDEFSKEEIVRNLLEDSDIAPGDIEIYFSKAKVTSLWKREVDSIVTHLTQRLMSKLD
jgi:hypothetical protein